MGRTEIAALLLNLLYPLGRGVLAGGRNTWIVDYLYKGGV